MQSDHERALAMFRNRVAEYTGVGSDFAERWRSWCRTLLSFDGELVVPPLKPEPRLDDLIVGSQAFEPPVHVLGLGGDCHANVAKLWIAERFPEIGAGYALYQDGYWRQHSWGLDQARTVVETKLRYERYVGVAIPAGEPTARFVMRNYEGDVQRMLRSGSGRWADITAVLQKKRR